MVASPSIHDYDATESSNFTR